ncbi:DUF6157 family protein [Sphingobacterium chuzhouense]|uniref:Uncharacterized protein n=1 Tax=Sphingobacterium chuzhouense TaxID=1742264 RepID=A0ABR7XSE5_9SPHI|nr:DUF6157 family protein [Sphingobacterium chuzhouense]MBD1422097.1 hypothetical protein [Sphingobacterium chuzhouense]
MKTHTTNYVNTFIAVAEDTKVACGTIPPSRGDKKTVAEIQYELLAKNPYKFTSDDVLFQVFADRNDLTETEYEQAREQFFSKGQPCFRASPLTKTYGFGIHCDDQGKMATYGMETPEYQKLIADKHLKHVKAMKSSK